MAKQYCNRRGFDSDVCTSFACRHTWALKNPANKKGSEEPFLLLPQGIGAVLPA
jgi:hypothetical protein